MKIPTIERLEKSKRKGQSISCFPISPVKPSNELTAMIKIEVATAFFMGKYAKKTSAGIIINPPPAPAYALREEQQYYERALLRVLFYTGFRR